MVKTHFIEAVQRKSLIFCVLDTNLDTSTTNLSNHSALQHREAKVSGVGSLWLELARVLVRVVVEGVGDGQSWFVASGGSHPRMLFKTSIEWAALAPLFLRCQCSLHRVVRLPNGPSAAPAKRHLFQ